MLEQPANAQLSINNSWITPKLADRRLVTKAMGGDLEQSGCTCNHCVRNRIARATVFVLCCLTRGKVKDSTASFQVNVKRTGPRVVKAAASGTARARVGVVSIGQRRARPVPRLKSLKSDASLKGPDPRLVREISVLFGRAKRLIFAKFERQFAALGESVQTWRALSQLKLLGRVAQFELARAMAQHPGGISRLLDELEKEGLVKRHRDLRDRRKVWVELTDRGHCRYDALRPAATRVLHQVLAPLSNADCRSLSRLLTKIMEAPNATQAD